jgi:hypothetical protein
MDPDDPVDPFADQPDTSPDWLQLAIGNDNPYYELRRPGDPGGIGYFRVCGRAQLVDAPNTACTVGLQAVTPAGRDFDGLPDGPTVVMPAFSWYHELDNGTAFQGFFGKNVYTDSLLARQNFHRRYQCGVAVQRPLWPGDVDGSGGVYCFLEALGRYRYDPRPDASQSTWEVLPGLHWQMAEKMWLSGAVVLPCGPSHSDRNQFQLTCSFQF